MSAEDIKAKIVAGLKRAALRTGLGAEFETTLLKPGALDETVYPPVPGPDIRLPATAFMSSYSIREAATSLVNLSSQRLMIVGDDLRVTANDRLEVATENGTVLLALSNVQVFMPGGIALYYTATGEVIKE